MLWKKGDGCKRQLKAVTWHWKYLIEGWCFYLILKTPFHCKQNLSRVFAHFLRRKHLRMDTCTGTCKSLDCLHARKRLRSCTGRSMSTAMESFQLHLEKMLKQWSVTQMSLQTVPGACGKLWSIQCSDQRLNRGHLSLCMSSFRKKMVSFPLWENFKHWFFFKKETCF